MQALTDFKSAAETAGLILPAVQRDGLLHRVKTLDDKAGKKSGWYVFYPGEFPAGAYGNWKTAESSTWSHQPDTPLTPAERETLHQRMALAKAARQAEILQTHQQTAVLCQTLWDKAHWADSRHPYLIRKGVKAFNIKAWHSKNTLIIPIFDAREKLINLQFIQADGQKKFKSGGRVEGGYFVLPPSKEHQDKRIYFCEGYATGASLLMALDAVIVVTFSAGNMPVVAEKLRKLTPERSFVFCVDNDKNGIGIKAGVKACEFSGGQLVIPEFDHLKTANGATDFNDLHQLANLDEIRRQMTEQLDWQSPTQAINGIQAGVIQEAIEAAQSMCSAMNNINRLLEQHGIDCLLPDTDIKNAMKSLHKVLQDAQPAVQENECR